MNTGGGTEGKDGVPNQVAGLCELPRMIVRLF